MLNKIVDIVFKSIISVVMIVVSNIVARIIVDIITPMIIKGWKNFKRIGRV